MTEKNINKIGWLASALAIAMYFSYIDQIMRNVSGHPGSLLLPLVTVINCSAWTMYGSLKTSKDWPIIICNVPGVVLGIITFSTAILWG